MTKNPFILAVLFSGVMATAQAKDHNQGCYDCGKVTSIHVVEKKGEGGALGVIAGGAAGGLLGHQVGGGKGKTLATIAGAVGGAYAGNKIQEKATASKQWKVDVEYDDGRRNSFYFAKEPGMRAGDRVHNAGKSITRM
ncbi:MAG: glycine zipper 2TM domain-containing protein [Massilia sp.]